MKNILKIGALACAMATTISCTDLESESFSQLSENNAYTNEETLLNGLAGVYSSLGFIVDNLFQMSQTTTDETIVPSRGADWNSKELRNLHTHEWTNDNGVINGVYETASLSIAKTNAFLESVESAGFDSEQTEVIKAEARFVRAYVYYLMCDNFGQVPIITAKLNENPTQSSRKDVFDFIIDELDAIENTLPLNSDYGRVNRNAVWFLKAKMYLNSEVFTGEDMYAKALEACNKIIDAGVYSLYNENNADNTKKIADIFAHDNDAPEKRVEAIFAMRFESATDNWGKAFVWQQYTLHYNLQAKYGLPESPWNGYATIREAVERYDVTEGANQVYTSTDQRFYAILTGLQEHNGVALTERDETTPLNFTLDFRSLENATEANGARVLKFVPGGTLVGSFLSNDFPIFRYSDVLMMKAEILARQGGGTVSAESLALINKIRVRSGAAPLATATMNDILDERGREFLWELWRRNDLVRFDKFTTSTWSLKTKIGEAHRNLFPIPTQQIDRNNKLNQNTGY